MGALISTLPQESPSALSSPKAMPLHQSGTLHVNTAGDGLSTCTLQKRPAQLLPQPPLKLQFLLPSIKPLTQPLPSVSSAWRLLLIWINDADHHGYAVDFISLSMHAISRDLEAYPMPCIYTQIETDDDFDYGDEDGDEMLDNQDAGDLSRVQEMRLVPSDSSVLDNLFKTLCDCALLNPDPEEELEGEADWFFNEDEVLAGAIGHSNGVKDHDVTGLSELHLDDEQFDDAEELEE